MKTVTIEMSKYRKLRLKELGYKYSVQGVFFVVETDKTHTELLEELDK